MSGAPSWTDARDASRRHGVGNLHDLRAREARPSHSGFKAYEPGYIHIDVKYLPKMVNESSRRYLFAAIDRTTKLGSLSVSITAKPQPTRGASC